MDINGLEKQLNYVTTLVFMIAELNIINARLIDVLGLTDFQKKQYRDKIKTLKTEKKRLSKFIDDYMKGSE